MTSGLAMYDCMQLVKPDVSCICMGMAASAAAGCWLAEPRASAMLCPTVRIMIHQPWIGQIGGQASDIDIHARQILKTRETLNKILADHTGQTPIGSHATPSATITCRPGGRGVCLIDQVITRDAR